MITTYQYTTNDTIDTRSEAIANKALSKINAYFQDKHNGKKVNVSRSSTQKKKSGK